MKNPVENEEWKKKIGENIKKIRENMGMTQAQFVQKISPWKKELKKNDTNKISRMERHGKSITLDDLMNIARVAHVSMNTLVYGNGKGGQQQAPGEELTIRKYARLLLYLIEITGSKVEKNEGGGVKIVFDERAPMGSPLPFNQAGTIFDEKDRPKKYNFMAWQLEIFLSLIANLQTMNSSLRDSHDKLGSSTAIGITVTFLKIKKMIITDFLDNWIVDETPEAAPMSEKTAHRYDNYERNYEYENGLLEKMDN